MQIMKAKLLYSIIFLFNINLFAQNQTIYIWRDVEGMKKEPSVMFVHKPKTENNGACVIVCPGGSYHHLDLYAEGHTTAEWFAEQGFTSFMLKYRTNQSLYNAPAMLEDLQRAIQIVRENADEFGVDPNRLGVIGFSAGGHLVAMAGEFFETHNELKKLGIETDVSLRPDFVVPVYPVVSMQDDIAHRWSRNSLLGYAPRNKTQERKDEFSLELQVPDNMPPTYVVVAEDDPVVIPENAKRLYAALEAKNIPNCRIAIYEWGKHGFGMKPDTAFMKTFHWNEALKDWLIEIGIISK
jgi:acetyl esterase/lipase